MTNEQLDKIAMDFDEAIDSHDPSKIVNQIKSAKKSLRQCSDLDAARLHYYIATAYAELGPRDAADRTDKIHKQLRHYRESLDTPALFTQIRQPSTEYLAMPEVSSSRRRYIPFGYLSPDIIASNMLYLIPNIDKYMFGVMTSNVHMAWMRVIGGRLKSDYRYTPAVYNNFPWPTPTDAQKAAIEQTAQAILDARALYPDCSLADLYDEVTMPVELRRAHQVNDKAVMQAYGFWGSVKTESDCAARLMEMYAGITK